jgi:hypothetical protein
MAEPTRRSPLPPLEYRAPDCPICHREVSHDSDSFYCESCKGTWSSDSYDAEGEANPEVEQCPAEVMPFYGREDLPSIRHHRYRCVRDASHPAARWPDLHVGVRSDGGVDYLGAPFEWRDGDYPQWTPEEASHG